MLAKDVPLIFWGTGVDQQSIKTHSCQSIIKDFASALIAVATAKTIYASHYCGYYQYSNQLFVERDACVLHNLFLYKRHS